MTDDILASVRLERERQDTKWGVQDHAPVKFLAILSEEHGELAKEVVEYLAADSRADRAVRLSKLREKLRRSGRRWIAGAPAGVLSCSCSDLGRSRHPSACCTRVTGSSPAFAEAERYRWLRMRSRLADCVIEAARGCPRPAGGIPALEGREASTRMCNELIQVAAVAVAMVEAIERNRDFWAGPMDEP